MREDDNNTKASPDAPREYFQHTEVVTKEETVDLSTSPVVLSSQFSSVSVRCIVNKYSWLDVLPGVAEIYRNVLVYTPR